MIQTRIITLKTKTSIGQVESFTDASSVNPAMNSDERIAISAQVPLNADLTWHAILHAKAQSQSCIELKAQDLIPIYIQQSSWSKQTINKTLRSIKIHICDPGQYVRPIKRNWNLPDPKTLSSKQRKVVENFKSTLRFFAGNHMLNNSPMSRLLRNLHFYRHRSGYALFSGDFTPPPKPSLQQFAKNGQHLQIARLANAVAESESVFFEAISAFSKTQSIPLTQAPPPFYVSLVLMKRISASHAFDKGDSTIVGWIDDLRSKTINRIASIEPLIIKPPVHKLVELDSAESTEIQAADVAAGIVQHYWPQPNGLKILADTFDQIQVNGKSLHDLVRNGICSWTDFP